MILHTTDKDLKKAAELLKNGGLVAIPTETVYGLAANALDPAAVAGIFRAKGRPADNPLIVHIACIDDLDQYAVADDRARALARAFWPGPLTMILPKKPVIPAIVSAGLPSVAIRFPSHPTAQTLIRLAGVPLAAPSANRSGKPSATKAEHVENDYEGTVPVVDDGESACGVESTVVSLVSDPPVLLRPGFITPAMLRTVLPDLVVADAVLHELKEDEKALSPGLKHRHYAPDAETVCISGPTPDAVKTVGLMTPHTMKACVICYDEEAHLYPGTDTLPYGPADDEAAQAAHVFDALRKADRRHYDRIYVRTRLSDGVGLAVYNRLLRACAFHVVHAEDTPLLVGVTGPSGSGKSVFGDVLRAYGFTVIDADKVYADILPTLLDGIAAAFGAEMVTNGTLDRKALARVVFADPEKKKQLEDLTHPAVVDAIKQRVLAAPARRVAVEAIGLLETGFAALCDTTVTVYADKPARTARIMARDHLCEEEAVRRLDAQNPAEYYTSRTDCALRNDTLTAFENDAKKLIETILEEIK